MNRVFLILPLLLGLAVLATHSREVEVPIVVAEPDPAPYFWETSGRHLVVIDNDQKLTLREQRALARLEGQGFSITCLKAADHPDLAQQFGSEDCPVFLLFEDGDLVSQIFTLDNLLWTLKALKWVVFLL